MEPSENLGTRMTEEHDRVRICRTPGATRPMHLHLRVLCSLRLPRSSPAFAAMIALP
jgi:hypothetical protein